MTPHRHRSARPTRFLIALLALAWMVTPGLSALAADEKPRVTALVLFTEQGAIDAGVTAKLKAEGIELVLRRLSDPTSVEQMKLFDAVILPDFNGVSTPYFVPRELLQGYFNAKRNLDEIRKYVDAGGGLMVVGFMTGGGQEVSEGCAALLEPMGIEMLPAQVRDDAHAGMKGSFAWTTSLAKGPWTQGVERVWYPTNMLRWDDAYATTPFVLKDKAWTPVVRGMPGSVAAKGLQYTTWHPIEGQKEPTIMAARELGKGRVAALGVCGLFSFIAGTQQLGSGWYGESNTGAIDGIFLEKGEGKESPSGGATLIANSLRWLAEPAAKTGIGGYTPDKLKAIEAPKPAPIPAWMTWHDKNVEKHVKTLIGVHSALSDGKGTIAEHAAAAKQAGYGVMVVTESFAKLSRENFEKLVAECRAATTPEIFVMPGIDTLDSYQNRFLLMGPRSYPEPFMLTPDGKAFLQTQYLSLGFGTHNTAIHRPGSTPMPQELYKHYSSLVVATYRNGKMIDNGLLAYQAQIHNTSNPVPLAVHEVYAPEEIAVTSKSGMQLFIPADTPAAAAWYLRAGMQHFWENPCLLYLSEGPVIRALSPSRVLVSGREHTQWDEKRSETDPHSITVESDAKIAEVRLVAQHYAERVFRPMEQRATIDWNLPPSHLRLYYLHITDEKGRVAITPPMRQGPEARYTWRCSDRQNFFGHALIYTGTNLADVDIVMPVPGTREGSGIWGDPHGIRGSNLAALLAFPFNSPALYVTDAVINERYTDALWEDVVFDAKPSRGTTAARVYSGRVRYYDFNLSEQWREKDPARPMLIKEIDVQTRMPVTPGGAVYPQITSVPRDSAWGFTDESGKQVTGKLDKEVIELPVGAWVNDLIVLSPGLRVAPGGAVGFAPPSWNNGPLPVGTRWHAEYVRAPAGQTEAMRKFMGFAGQTPWRVDTTLGKVERVAYVVHATAENWGLAGAITAAPDMPYPLPLWIRGVNANWDAAVVRDGAIVERFAVFEGVARTRLDAKKPGAFYAGNLVTCDQPDLRLTVLRWDKASIVIEAHNASARDVSAAISTPTSPALGELKRVEKHAAIVPAGKSVVIEVK